jgi:solute carrier family 25 protein 33/36
MNTKSVSALADQQRHQIHPSQLLQSRETGELGPVQSRYASTIAKPAPVAKSWAHFVAGGHVSFPSAITEDTRLTITWFIELEA